MEDLSRRELLQKFIPKFQKETTKIVGTPEIVNSEVKQLPLLDRKTFLKFIGVLGAVLAVEQVGIKTTQAQENKGVIQQNDTKNPEQITKETPTNKQLKPENVSNKIPKPETKLEAEQQGNKENSYLDTAIEQSLMRVATRVTGEIFKRMKIQQGNQSLNPKLVLAYLRDYPISGVLEAGILGPAVEEAIFRALPSVIIDRFVDTKDNRSRWEVGIPTSVLFALYHNFKKGESGEWEFIKSVTMSQFMSGLFYWYLMREKGYSHTLLAHSMNNAIPFSIGALLFKIYPEKKAASLLKYIP